MEWWCFYQLPLAYTTKTPFRYSSLRLAAYYYA